MSRAKRSICGRRSVATSRQRKPTRDREEATAPLFLLAEELERISPNLANLRAAERDLLAAVGAKAALTSRADAKLLQHS
jgi:hypothetical protein